MSRDIAPFGVRMPAELKEQLQAMAAENKRSINSEIVAAVEMAVGIHQLEKDIGAKHSLKPKPEAEKQYLVTEADLKSLIAEITTEVFKRLK